MKVIAKQIGNSKKERIEVDGEVYLKAVAIERWNYVSKIVFNVGEENEWFYYAKHSDKAKAEKYSPDCASDKIYWPSKSQVAQQDRQYGEGKGMEWARKEIKRFKDAVANGASAGYERCRYSGRRFKVARVQIPYQQEIVKVERS